MIERLKDFFYVTVNIKLAGLLGFRSGHTLPLFVLINQLENSENPGIRASAAEELVRMRRTLSMKMLVHIAYFIEDQRLTEIVCEEILYRAGPRGMNYVANAESVRRLHLLRALKTASDKSKDIQTKQQAARLMLQTGKTMAANIRTPATV